jgi:hypothetical protein
MTMIMKIPMLRLILLGLVSTSLALAPTHVLAQAEKKAEAEKKEAPAKKRETLPFNGKVAAIDKTAKTFTVGQRKFQLTSDSRITKAGKPATLDDAAVGEEVAGSYLRAEDGKLNVVSVRFGLRPEGEPKGEKKSKKQPPPQ